MVLGAQHGLCTLHAPMVPHVSLPSAKRIHLVAAPPADCGSVDARLSEGALRRCDALAELTARLDSIELVVCSPLTRSLEAASAGFAAHVARGGRVVALEALREIIETPVGHPALSPLYPGLAQPAQALSPHRPHA